MFVMTGTRAVPPSAEKFRPEEVTFRTAIARESWVMATFSVILSLPSPAMTTMFAVRSSLWLVFSLRVTFTMPFPLPDVLSTVAQEDTLEAVHAVFDETANTTEDASLPTVMALGETRRIPLWAP